MSSRLHFGEFGPAQVAGHVLVVLCAYRGGVGQRAPFQFGNFGIRGLGRVLNFVSLLSLRMHIATLRDHYANPRGLAMQVELAKAALTLGSPSTVRVIVDEAIGDTSALVGIEAPQIETLTLANSTLAVADVDTTLLVYPDALGLGFGRFEARLLAAGARNTIVVTGRRRIFPLTSDARLWLRWRRALAATRLPELAAALVVLPVAAVLAGYDRIRGQV